ncbi:MAG TPA: polysaccharide deacetylase family protein [Candidatus Saccharimonadales bacterium]|nr:polysaccharide deacetylase family protein [Candidatus Saccharimonadales bacterium]
MKYLSKVRNIYNKHVRNKNKEARFLVLVFFTLTFVLARIIVYGITYHLLPSFPFAYIFYKEVHVHHLVFGIILLLIAGFIRIPAQNNHLIRISSVLYGIGAALTLDEFAIWLRLDPNAYFGPEGRISIDAVILFTMIILLTLWYGNFLKKIVVFTFYFLGFHKMRPKKYLKKLHHLKKLFPYAGLGLFTFFTVVLVLPSPAFLAEHTVKQQLLTNAIINAQDLEDNEAIASLSATPTPQLTEIASDEAGIIPTITETPQATSTPSINTDETATVSADKQVSPADFCLNVPVLMYHHVQPMPIAESRGQSSLTVDTTVFDQQMQYLVTHGYKTISAEDLVLAIRNHTYIPPTDVVITLDDGYEDNYTDAFAVAKKYKVILNMMIPTGLLNNHPENTDNYYLSWTELKEMVDSGLVNAYDHSWSHYPMGTGDFSKNQFEILTPKQQLEQNLGKTVDIFTYPYGSGQDMPWVMDLLQKDGFIGAFSTIGGSDQCESFIMSLHRYHVGSSYFPDFGIN